MTEHELKEKAAFFAMIRADPGNNDTRLVFADWCEEHGELELAGMLRGASETWLREYAHKFKAEASYYDDEDYGYELSYDDLIKAAHAYLDHGDYRGLGFMTPDHVWADRIEFWKHFEVMTGRAVPDDQKEATFFSCAC
jgi:uncharacterized protein (TIGR02996 family)